MVTQELPRDSAILHRWTRQEYEQMIDVGAFAPDQRMELIDGEIFEMTPQSSKHSTAIRLIEDILRSIFKNDYDVRTQLPLAIDEYSEPEPDIAVVVGSPRDYTDAHPTTALLIVEVANTSLEYDQERKQALYARNGIPEYWILNLAEAYLDVYREPRESRYSIRLMLFAGDTISPLSRPMEQVSVADLLP